MSPDPLARLTSLEGVASAMAATRDGIDALLRDRGLRRTAAELTTESLLRGAHASAVLEGSVKSLDEVRSGDLDAPAEAALRISTELLSLTATFAAAPLQVFARLHVLAAGGTHEGDGEDDQLGRPVSPEAAQRLADLAGLLMAPTTAPALVTAAIVHAELVTVAPFASYNGIVARAAERLLIVARGVDPTSLVVPEEGHRRLRAEYESNLGAYAHGGPNGVQAWLLYCAEAYAAGANASPLHP
jgi:hypothetical protein